ncbi:MAG: hypothetical protein CMC15_15355, partial [Flavobacteriaceae bacterium]|nr:hypothetical protein [Flavobacteriaceae bacterium]
MGVDKVTCRAPHFSQWLCRQKRLYKFKYHSLAFDLGVSPQCIDSYANGRAHPQIMKFQKLIAFVSEYREDTYFDVLKEAMNHIKKDRIEYEKKIQQKYLYNKTT